MDTDIRPESLTPIQRRDNGIAHLDAHPELYGADWRDTLDADSFDIYHECDCVLGQLLADFSNALSDAYPGPREWRDRIVWAQYHGFFPLDSCQAVLNDDIDNLDDVWKDYIRQHQAAKV